MAPQQPTRPAFSADDYDIEAPVAPAEPTAPESAPPPSSPALNAAGRPYDPSTGRLISAENATPRSAPDTAPSEKLLKRARAAGVGEDIIASVGREQLEDITHSFLEQQVQNAHRMADYRRSVANDHQAARDPRTTPRGGTGPTAGEDASGGHDAPPSPDTLVDWGEIEDVEDGKPVKKSFRDQLHQNFVKVVEDQAKQIKTLQTTVQTLMQAEAVRASLTNKQVAQMELSKYPDLFGSADLDTLDPEGPEAAKLNVLRLHMNGIPKDKRTTFAKDLAKGIQLLFGVGPKVPGKPAEAAKPKPDVDPRWRDGAAARPTQRSGATEPPGVDKAIAGVRRFRQEVAETNGQTKDFDDGL